MLLWSATLSASHNSPLFAHTADTIPVAEGYVIGSSIKHVPIAGRDITDFVLQLLRDRAETAAIPPEDQRRVAEKIKEDYTYVCQDIVKEFKKYDADPYRYFARYSGEHSVTGRVSRDRRDPGGCQHWDIHPETLGVHVSIVSC